MLLPNNKDKILCVVRTSWVTATPEEKLRQTILRYMLGKGGYPKGCVAVEVLVGGSSGRRADIVVYTNTPSKGFSPLFIVECKAVKLTPSMLQQVGGYNYFFEAPFIALANAEESYWGWLDSTTKSYRLQWGFPSFKELTEMSLL